ncbi:hypothetical protein LOTGIDRAFT_147536 [Lottia gigantea]|uniref:Major facilitator superfamily (MFS) profile domain-containing protein n=1 Tax=Lottia gigantea TaxID=225164 RepID=V4ABB6_LOTGI|nr:hypothetical protein LOTGIDRAFT_147536 [Lottia gigantea]ESO94102.1 hypothetical protein LOTGIDRAFT_147536 [Lottia gigantea]
MNFNTYIICYQYAVGIGLSLTFLLPFTVVGEMFEEKRVTMVTVVSVFIGVGNVYFPFLISVLNEVFGWRGTFLIIGAYFLNCVPVGILIMFFRKRREQLVGIQKTDFKSLLNCEPAFLVVSLNCFIMTILFTILNTFFVDMMRSRHFDVQDGPFLLSINGFASIGGRVLLTDKSPFLKCKRMTIWPLFLFLCSVTVLTFAYFETYNQLLVICILYGLFWGSCAVLYPAIVMDISGLKMYSTALGYINFIGGVAGMFGGPLAGDTYILHFIV